MKTKTALTTALIAGLSIIHLPRAFGQGDLNPPPGPPAPVMKTLDQVEPRIIVNATNTPGDAANSFIISSPGSYYLTGNLTGESDKNGISIQSNDVVLDLNGFAIISGGGEAVRGINTPNPISNLSVRNGAVRGWGGGGAWVGSAVALVEQLRVSENGYGLTVGNGSVITDCVASKNITGFWCPDRVQISNCISTVNSGNGFECTSNVNLMDCTSSRNGGDGIVVLANCSLNRCSVTRNLTGNGIHAGTGCTIANCTVSDNGGQGIWAGAGSTIRNCTVRIHPQNGIYCDEANCHIIGNTCDLNDTGIVAVNARVEGNNCTSNSYYGIWAEGLVIRNSAHGNGYNGTYNFSISGATGPIVNMTGGGTITSTSPWANFSY